MAALQASGAISLSDIEEQYNPGTNCPSLLNDFILVVHWFVLMLLIILLQICQQMYRQAQQFHLMIL